MGQQSYGTKAGARAEDFIDLDSYPLEGDDQALYADVLKDARAQLEDDGCCVLRGFIREDMIPVLAAEGDRVAKYAHQSFNRTNAYFSEDDPALPQNDPRRRFYDRSNAFVPADHFGADSGLRAIYEFAPF